VHACTKGRFHDTAENKLDQLTRSKTNEIVTIDFAAMIHRVVPILEAGVPETPCEA
jgi:hypothetical protein